MMDRQIEAMKFVQAGNRIVLLPLSDVIAQSVHQKVYFYDEEPAVLDALSEFICNYEYENESIMILISGMLISATNAMTVENYESAYEYSCSLYYHLMKWKNANIAKNVFSLYIRLLLFQPAPLLKNLATCIKKVKKIYSLKNVAYHKIYLGVKVGTSQITTPQPTTLYSQQTISNL